MIYHQNTLKPTNNGLNVINFNIHSMRNKLELIEAELTKLPRIDIIVITETWMIPGTEDMYNLEGFTAYHESRNDGYGGLAVYVRDNLSHTCVTRRNFQNIQMIVIKLSTCRIIAVYRQPVSSNTNSFFQVIDDMLETTEDCLLVGDMNIDTLSPNSCLNTYMSVLESNSTCILNHNQADYYTYSTSSSILDHFCVNFFDKRFELSRYDTAISDHVMLLLAICEMTPETNDTEKVTISWDRVTKLFREFIEEDVHRNLSSIHDFLIRTISLNKKSATSNCAARKSEWCTPRILAEMKLRDFLHARRKAPGLTVRERHQAFLIYKRQRNRVTGLIRLEKRNEIDRLVISTGGDQNKLWQVIRYILTNKKSSSSKKLPSEIQTSNGVMLTDPQAISDELVDFFSNVAEDLKTNLLQSNNYRPIMNTLTKSLDCSIRLTPTNPTEVSKVIRDLKIKSAMGFDYVSPRFIKYNNKIMSEQLAFGNNEMFKSGCFPETFKKARLSCIFKNGDARCCTNYRPVSVLPAMTKVSEKLLYDRIFKFLNNNNFFHPNQFGFIPETNTTGAALYAINNIIEAIESRNVAITLFIDVSKAFDCVNHALLLDKLSSIGISGKCFDLISSYLFGRTQCMQNENVTSHERPIRHGVPQGSRLSALLFLIYINDIFEIELEGQMQLYADDIMIIYKGKDVEHMSEIISRDLIKLNDWFYNNLLSFNTSKTKYMIIAPKNKRIEQSAVIVVNGCPIERVYSYKYLGLIFDHKLMWNDHVSYIKKKLKPILALFRKTSYLLPSCTKLSVYYSHFHTHLTYMASVWGATADVRLAEIERMQNKAIRFIFWHEYRHGGLSTDEIYAKHRILKMKQIVGYESCMVIYKIKNSLLKTNIDLCVTSDIHEHETRRRSHINIPLSRTNYSRNSIFHRGINLFNSIPSSIRKATLPLFRKHLKHFLL